MIEFQARIQRAAESILENETLTADLDDETARVLLDWGVERAQAIASETLEMDETQAEESMYQPMRALRKMLRTVNQWVIDPQEGSLEKILGQATIVYGSIPDVEQQAIFLAQIPGEAVGRVKALRNLIEGEGREL